MVLAFVAAEGDDLFEQPGIDIRGIIRAFVHNIQAGRVVEGGSTITQQLIKTLLLTGFITNVCVETCARHAYIKGYYVVVVSDCTDAATEREYESTLFNIKTYFGKVVSSEEIKRTLEG